MLQAMRQRKLLGQFLENMPTKIPVPTILKMVQNYWHLKNGLFSSLPKMYNTCMSVRQIQMIWSIVSPKMT